MADDPGPGELFWREYNLHIELHKFYMDAALKANLFFYTITGAMVSFYFANCWQTPSIKFSLLLPTVMAVTLGGGFVYAAILSVRGRRQIFAITERIGLRAHVGRNTAIEVKILTVLLWAFGALFLVVAGALIFLVFYPVGVCE